MHMTTSDMWSLRIPSESTQRTCDIGRKNGASFGEGFNPLNECTIFSLSTDPNKLAFCYFKDVTFKMM